MNGYCQIELGGQPRGLKFNLHAVEMLEKLFKQTNADQQSEDVTPTLIKQLVYVGLCGNRYVKTMGTEPVCEETFEQVSDWIDEFAINKQYEFIKIVNDAFASSKAVTVPIEEKKNQRKQKKTV